MSAGIGVTQHH